MKAKKIVSLLLAAAMTVSMAACGGSNQTSASKNNSNNAAGDAADEDATESEYPRKLPKMKRKISQISFRKRQLLSMYSIS